MKAKFSIITITVAFMILCASCFAGGQSETSSSSDALSGSSNEFSSSSAEKQGKETTFDLVNDGNTDYVIIIPDNATENEQFAADELSFFLGKATGTEFKISKESSSSSDKYLSIGQTEALKATNIETDKATLGSSGYIVKTIGCNVYLSGAKDLGTVYSVYKFLEEQVGYTYYSYDCIVYDEVETAKLLDFNVVDVPSFEHRFVTTRSIRDYNDRMMRYKFMDPHVDDVSFLMHSAQYIISYSIYGEQHPEWFASQSALCYSAGESLINEVVTYYQNVLAETPEEAGKEILFFGQSDDGAYCTCSKCQAAVEKYGSLTSTMIMFLNQVSDRLQVWIDENQQGRDVQLMFFAYKWSQNPPVQYDEATGKYTYSEDVVMRDNVGVLLAPIFASMDTPYSGEINKSEKICIESWAQITENLSYYGYYINYTYPMYLMNNFDKQAEDYKYLEELGVKYIMELDMTWVDQDATFGAYKSYLTSNLMWDNDKNPRELTIDFFNNYYREGASYLLKYFDEWKNQYYVLKEEYGFTGSCYDKMDVPEYWPISLLERWLGYMDEAMLAIERYKYVDSDLYESLYKHILIEKTCLQYRMIELHGSNYYKNEELIEVKTEVLNNMSRFNMTYLETSSAYSNLLALADKWGIKIQ